MGYLIHFFLLFFSGGHLITHCFRYLRHLSIFQYFSFYFMNNFCIAHASSSAIETFQERHLQELGAFILTNLFLYLFPNVGVEHFWVDDKHVVAQSQCRSSRYMWSVHDLDLDLESMISFSTRVIRFDQTQYNDKQYMQKVFLNLYLALVGYCLPQRRGVAIHFTF